MNIKIIRIIARLNIGGPARNAVLLTEGLRSKGFETVLLCGEVSEGESDMMYLAKEKDIEPLVIKELGRELSLKYDWQAFWKIYRIVCKEKPHIIHTHTAKAGTLGRLAGILYNFSSKKKVVLIHTFHGHVLYSYFGKVKTFFFIWIEKILAYFTDRVITVSASLKKELVKRFRIAPEKKFSVVELGFELDRLLALEIDKKSDIVNIGIVGRLVPVKNHRMLLKAASILKEHVLDTKVKFVIIGDGELREDLEDYAAGLKVSSIVEFRGWIKDLCEIYGMLDVVTLTSLNEGTPVSIIEAMATGKPVVATNVGGVSDIIEDGKNGYLIPPDNDKVFAEKLLDLIRDSEKRRQFGEYGRELVRNRFSKERLINDMDKLYNDLLKDRRL